MNDRINLNNEDSDIKFIVNNDNENPIIRLCKNGDIYIKGKLTENAIEVVNGIREFLRLSKW